MVYFGVCHFITTFFFFERRTEKLFLFSLQKKTAQWVMCSPIWVAGVLGFLQG
jgi:hypothetical protein